MLYISLLNATAFFIYFSLCHSYVDADRTFLPQSINIQYMQYRRATCVYGHCPRSEYDVPYIEKSDVARPFIAV